MVEIVEAPDIVNPFNIETVFQLDRTTRHDLNLEVLIHSALDRGSVGAHVVERALYGLTEDARTIAYRQDAFDELINNEEVRKTARSFISGLGNIGRKLQEFEGEYHARLENGLNLLREYVSFIDNLPQLDSADSSALKDVHTYFERVKYSQTFQETRDLVERIENLGGVNFSVSFDEKCMPASMTALELYDRKKEETKEPQPEEEPSFWQRILGRRKAEPEVKVEQEEIEGKALKNPHNSGLNDLARDIYSFVEDQFVSVINEYSAQIKELTSSRFIGSLGFYVGFSEYFAKLQEAGFDLSRPTILSKEERRTIIRNAKNPVIVAHRNNGNVVVPNDITQNPDENMFVITGPNNGGKTTYVKTVGLLQVLAQCGLFVPAESAEVSLVDGIYTHFVAPDDITRGEGRYRNELRRMKYIFEHASPYSLVILDEPCGGTSYEEGQRQSLTLLDGFHKLGVTTYFTTHMHPVTSEVENGRFTAARNLSVDCIDDGEKLTYTFKIKSGASGKSYGEEIAREIGLRPENIGTIVSQKAEEKGYTHLLRK